MYSIWIKQVLAPIEEDVSNMSASTCSGWLNQTETIPEYLSQGTIARYQESRVKVEHQLHSCRVQGVVSMFNALSTEEKEECLKILQNAN